MYIHVGVFKSGYVHVHEHVCVCVIEKEEEMGQQIDSLSPVVL